MAGLDFSSRAAQTDDDAPLDFAHRAAPPESPSFAAGKAQAKNGVAGAVAGGLQTLYEAIPGVDEAQAWVSSKVHTGADLLSGRAKLDPNDPAGSLKAIDDRSWKAERERQAGLMTGFREDHPVASNFATDAGIAAQAVPFLMTGGASAAPEALAAGKTLLQRAGSMAATAGRNAFAGGAMGEVNGMTGRGSASERLLDGGGGAILGAAAGVAAPVVMGGLGAVGGKIGQVAGALGRTGVRAANKIASETAGGAFLDPQRQVLSRLGESLQKDGLSPGQITEALSEWNRVGGASPAFMDLVAKNGGGQNTMALIRGAALTGEGRNVASQYGSRVAADLQDTAIDRTRALTPDEPRPAHEVAAALENAQADAASTDYAPAYAAPVSVTSETLKALADEPGKAALKQARKAAVARMDDAQVKEIDTLLGAADKPPTEVSGATLDRARIAFRERAKAAVKNDQGSYASGLRQRMGMIDQTLDNAPNLSEARANYRDFAQGIEGATETGPRLMTTPSDQFASTAAGYGDRGVAGLKVGGRQALVDAIEAPTAGATGALNRIGSSTRLSNNLAQVHGDQPAADYQASIGNMVDQVNNARFINPNTGSQTAGRLADEQLVESIPTSKAGVVRWIVDKFRGGSTLTDDERALLVRIATGKAEDVAPTVLPSMTGPRPAPSAPRQSVAPVALGAMTGQRRGSVTAEIPGHPEWGSGASR